MSTPSNLILIVDDNEAHRKLVRRVILKVISSYEIAEASSLAAARKIIFQEDKISPVLAIIDLNLTDGRGTSLLREIRLHPTLFGLPVIVLSTSSLDSDLQECLEAGATEYLTKATDLDAFTEIVVGGVTRILHLTQPVA